MNRIIDQIRKARHILLASHSNPDGDAIGSLLALGLSLGKLDKKATLYNASSIPAVYRFLPSAERIVRHMKPAVTYDMALVLDCGGLPRVGEAAAAIEQIPVLVNIDHHISNTRFGDLQLIDANASSTAEIVYRLIKAMQVPVDAAIATAIYTGILTDTGSFRFSNTTPEAFAISKEMAELGANPHDVAQHVFGTYSLGRIKLLNQALDSIEISNSGKLSMMTITRAMLKATGTHPEDVDGLINYARRIEDVKVAALIQEQKNGRSQADERRCFHVSLRSDGTVDVAAIAGAFGGGGHVSAAGFQINTTLTQLKSEIMTLMKNM